MNPIEIGLREHARMYPTDTLDPSRLRSMYEFLQIANTLRPGHYLELGVHRGLTLKLIYRCMDRRQVLHGFDTFEGFDQRDIDVERTLSKNNWKKGNFLPTSKDTVGLFVGEGEWPANLNLVAGWFPDSFRGYEKLLWRFAHIDMDLYAPTREALERLWPKMVLGGIIMVHDYGCKEFQARRAVDEFCERVSVRPLKLDDRYGSAVLTKGT